MSQDYVKHEYVFDHYVVRAGELTLWYDERQLPVAPKVVSTLIALVQSAGEVVTKDEVLERVWGHANVEESNVAQYVYILRRQFLEWSGQAYIETLPRRGYRFTGRVRERHVKNMSGVPINARYSLAAAAAALLLGASVLMQSLALGPASSSAERLQQTDRGTQLSAYAQKEYALGWYYWHGSTQSDLQASAAAFSRVVKDAPSSPLGYAGEAFAYARLADLWGGAPSGVSAAVTAEKLASQAVALDARSGVARAASGFVEFDIDGDNRAAVADLRQAVKADPNLAVAHFYYGSALLWSGMVGASREELMLASRVDPTMPGLDYALALAAYLDRDYKDAIALARLALRDSWSAEPAHLLLAAAYDEDRQYDAAIEAAKAGEGAVADPTYALAVGGTLAHIYASMGRRSLAAEALRAVERLSAHDQNRPVLTALAYASNGQVDEAFAWLSRLSASDRKRFALDPRFDSLHRDPRFAQWLHG